MSNERTLNVKWNQLMSAESMSLQSLLSVAQCHGSCFNAVNWATFCHRVAKFHSCRARRLSDVLIDLFRTINSAGRSGLLDFTAQHLATIVWSMAKTGVSFYPLKEYLVEAALVRHEKLKAHDLANLIWGLTRISKSSADSSGSVVRFIGVFERRVMNDLFLAEFKPMEVSSILWSIATVGHIPDNNILNRICVRYLLRVPHSEFTSQGIANTIWSLSQLGFFYEPLLESVGNYILDDVVLLSFKDQELSSVINSFHAAGYVHKGLFTRIAKHETSFWSELRPEALQFVLNGLGITDCTVGAIISEKYYPDWIIVNAIGEIDRCEPVIDDFMKIVVTRLKDGSQLHSGWSFCGLVSIIKYRGVSELLNSIAPSDLKKIRIYGVECFCFHIWNQLAIESCIDEAIMERLIDLFSYNIQDNTTLIDTALKVLDERFAKISFCHTYVIINSTTLRQPGLVSKVLDCFFEATDRFFERLLNQRLPVSLLCDFITRNELMHDDIEKAKLLCRIAAAYIAVNVTSYIDSSSVLFACYFVLGKDSPVTLNLHKML